jgi:hypothetical protein
MANNMHLIDALELENAALRMRVAELVRLLSAAQDACDKAEAERQHQERRVEQNLPQRIPAVTEPIEFGV